MKEYKIEVYLPENCVMSMIDNLSEAGACKIGNYDKTASFIKTKGCWRPLQGAVPYLGHKGELSIEDEVKLEFRCGEEFIRQVLIVINEQHPYEEPVYNILPLYNEYFT